MRNYAKRACGLVLALCMTASNLPCMEKVESANTAVVASNTASEDVVRGFGNKIKDKKEKKEKFNVNKEDKNGKAWN